MKKLEVKPLGKGRILIFNFAGLLATLGVYLLVWTYPTIQPAIPFFQKILYMAYIAFYPIFMSLVILEDIIFILVWVAKLEMKE